MNPPPEFLPGQILPEQDVRPWLSACGKGVKIFRGCRIVDAGRVSIGDFSQLDEGVHIFAGKGVSIGRHVHLAFLSSISGGGECLIGDFVGIGAGVRLVTGSDVVDSPGLTNPTIPLAFRAVRRGRLEINAHAVVFTNTIVLPDVVIGEGAVIAAGSIVHHDLRPWGIYAGHPLVQVGVRDSALILGAAQSLLAREPETT